MSKRAVVDTMTGEVEMYLRQGDKIVRGASMEYLRNTINVKYKDYGWFNIKELHKVLPTLTDSESALFLRLTPYVSYRNCCLQYGNGKDITLSGIVKITDMSKTTCIKATEGLIKKNIYYKGRNGKSNQYYVNPWIVNRGMTVSRVLKNMFKHYYIHEHGCKWSEL